jgi:hypothetical protein
MAFSGGSSPSESPHLTPVEMAAEEFTIHDAEEPSHLTPDFPRCADEAAGLLDWVVSLRRRYAPGWKKTRRVARTPSHLGWQNW